MSLFTQFLLLTVVGLQTVSSADPETAHVVNFDSSPVLIKPLSHGPGFTVENRSNNSISQFRFGCVKEESGVRTVPFAFIPEEIPLAAKGPKRTTTLKGWTPAQGACANRLSPFAVIEVLFADGGTWSAPLQFERVLGQPESIVFR
jgi:hypothetical protein